MAEKKDSGGYLGNPLLKKHGEKIEWTYEMLMEFQKCAKDPIYFAEKYIYIVNMNEGLIPIKLYDYQKEIITSITNNRRVVVNTARQSGKTTSASAIILHYILFNEHKTVALLANKADAAREIMDRIQISYQNLPKFLQQGVMEWNKGSIELENGCKVLAAASSSSAIRGKAVAFLYIDETAFLENWDEFYASVYPTISSGKESKVLLTSTPKGMNHFYKICTEAMEISPEAEKAGSNVGKNGFIYIEVKWDRVPGRDEKWKQDALASLGWNYDQFNQEFDCSFIGSSDTLISSQGLSNLVAKRPLQHSNNIFQYEQVKADRQYALISDVGRGKGLDYSAFSIIDVTEMPYKQVCVYRNNEIGPIDYAAVIHNFAKKYNEAMVLIEVNDIGGQVADSLWMDFGYENVLSTETNGRSGKRISGGFGRNVDRGIRTSEKVKIIGCSILKLLIEQNQLIICDENTIDELRRFSKKNNSYAAEKGSHDDLVMTLVLFAWLSDQGYFAEMTDINTLNKLREKTDDELDDMVMPFFYINDGNADDNSYWKPVNL